VRDRHLKIHEDRDTLEMLGVATLRLLTPGITDAMRCSADKNIAASGDNTIGLLTLTL
jgi:hypothetical protein